MRSWRSREANADRPRRQQRAPRRPHGDPEWSAWSEEALTECAESSTLAINPLLYAEVSIRFERIEELEEALPAADMVRRAPSHRKMQIRSRAMWDRGGAGAALLLSKGPVFRRGRVGRLHFREFEDAWAWRYGANS